MWVYAWLRYSSPEGKHGGACPRRHAGAGAGTCFAAASLRERRTRPRPPVACANPTLSRAVVAIRCGLGRWVPRVLTPLSPRELREHTTRSVRGSHYPRPETEGRRAPEYSVLTPERRNWQTEGDSPGTVSWTNLSATRNLRSGTRTSARSLASGRSSGH